MITLEHHILEHIESEQRTLRNDLFSLLLEISQVRAIAEKVRCPVPSGIHATECGINVHGESQTCIDLFANRLLIDRLSASGTVGLIISEEEEPPLCVGERSEGKFLVAFDPLDGSSNLETHASVGTIFSVYQCENSLANLDADLLQPGTRQLMAGYVLYGASTVLVYSMSDGVHGFTLDPAIGAFVLSHSNIQMPPSGNVNSFNSSLEPCFPEYCRRFLGCLKSGTDGQSYRSRYIGSLVADFHRLLLKGGIFLYPATACHPGGKLRLLYEANPIAFLAEQAGGSASDGTIRILDVVPHSVHQRVSLFVGSSVEMSLLAEFAEV